MIRVVVTVLLAVALLAVSAPALDDARAETTAERIGTEADRTERALAALVDGSVAVDDPDLAGRTTVVVHAPTGFAAARIERLALVNPSRTEWKRGEPISRDTRLDTETEAALLYRIRGGPTRLVAVGAPTDAVDVRVDGPIDLRTGGESRLEFRLVDDDGPTIRVSRVG